MRILVLVAMAVVASAAVWCAEGSWPEAFREQDWFTVASLPSPLVAPDQPAQAFSTLRKAELGPGRTRGGSWGGDAGRFFQGAFVGFVGHELGHVVANVAVGADIELTRVDFAFIPFFNIMPRRGLQPREHYITASAGFNAQNLTSEWILTTHPNLQDEEEPFLKGWGMFNFWLSVGYSLSAFTGYGPDERDTRGMARALGCSEDWVGLMVLAPALLDGYRYKHPQAKWARDASRLIKLLQIGLVFTVD